MSIEVTLYLYSALPDTVRFVPVNLCNPRAPARKPNLSDALQFTPAALAEFLDELRQLPDATARCDRLD
jgi:hypothetical protein